jgi:hypothetical protein
VARVLRTPRIGGGAWVAFAGKGAVEGSVTWTRTGTAWVFDSDKCVEASAADGITGPTSTPFRAEAVAKRVGRSHIGYIGNQTKVRRHHAAREVTVRRRHPQTRRRPILDTDGLNDNLSERLGCHRLAPTNTSEYLR